MTAFQKWLVWSSSALTGVTGLVYWWMKNRMEPLDEFAAINHPLEPWMLKAHILVAPLMVFAIGVIAGEHIWRQYRQRVRAGRRSGLLSAGVIAPLALSGYLIQTVSDAGWLPALAWGHLGTGLAYLVGLLGHHRMVRTLWPRGSPTLSSPRPEVPSGPPTTSSRAGFYGRTDASVGTTWSTRKDGSR